MNLHMEAAATTEPFQSAEIKGAMHSSIEGLSRRDACLIANRLEARLEHHGITLLPQTSRVSEADIRNYFPTGLVAVCDLYIDDFEKGSVEHPWGYEKNGIRNIDHHAPTAVMSRMVSSGNLACRYVAERGIVPFEVPVVINHLDCDSVVTALILRGHLPPHPAFEQAVLAADHTGARNPIADLLQSLDKCDPAFCARQLAALLREEPYHPLAASLLQERETQREAAQSAIAGGLARRGEGIVLVRPAVKVESDLLLPLFPKAVLIISCSEMGRNAAGEVLWETKLRLGAAAPAGLTLNALGARAFDSCFGGRWNAGSTSRSGGTVKTPEDYWAHYSRELHNWRAAAR